MLSRQERILAEVKKRSGKVSPIGKYTYLKNTIFTLPKLTSIDTPIEAKRKIFDMVAESIDNLAKLGVEFKFIGFEKESLERMETTKISVGNHTKSGIEAFYVHAMTPFNTRVVVKDSLIKLPLGIGEGFKTTDPIVMEQGTTSGVMRDILSTIKSGGRVHVFPEGTRSRDGALLEFKGLEGLVKISQRSGSYEMPVITTDSFSVINASIEDIFFKDIYPGEVRFYLDFVNIKDRNPEDAAKEIRSTMITRLDESLKQREVELGITQGIDT
jgi:1-acyl-sn-glycerol-3-phosphate acyltransferase